MSADMAKIKEAIKTIADWTQEDYRNYYDTNSDFKRYVDRHCNEFNLTVEEALQHALVKETAKYYLEAIKSKVSETGIVVGCGGADAPSGECV